MTAIGEATIHSALFTDTFDRVCVRFHWDRLSQQGELSSCWLRMLQPSSGPDWGSVHVPRAGEEVVVTFLDNDIDRPLIMGQVYGGHKPAWHSSGLMSGYKSKEIGGGGFNQWVMDDSTGQVRTQLHSSHGHTQLNLGYLIDQRGNHRGALRGTGFELRTDAYGALRAQQGLYLSTWKRSNAQGAQLDISEAQQQLQNSEQRLKTLSDTAKQHNAGALHHEQLGILQPLIYENWDFHLLLDGQAKLEEMFGVPRRLAAFSIHCETDDPDRDVIMKEGDLYNSTDRMNFITEIATKYHYLMDKDKNQMGTTISTIISWHNNE